MIFSTPNVRRIRFKLIDFGCIILRETPQQIVWAGERPPSSFGVEVDPA
jgi:hypothetical protein